MAAILLLLLFRCAGGQRNAVQVFSNGAPATVAATLYLGLAGGAALPIDFSATPQASFAALACLVALSGCCGDTWASEVGSVVGSRKPRLITTWRAVPPGTNGGMTTVGTAASCAGGFAVGLSYFITWLLIGNQAASQPAQWPVVFVGVAGGFLCSLLDSLLGATVQFSGFDHKRKCVVETPGEVVEWICGRAWLDNHTVNLLSSAVSALLLPLTVYWAGLFS